MADREIPWWSRIREALQEDIKDGVLGPGAQLPNDSALASRFGVNRHTVRRAVSELQRAGIVRVERGRGTFVVDEVLTYRLGSTVRYTENLLAEGRLASRDLLETIELPAPADVAEALKIGRGAPVARIRLLTRADGRPLMLGTVYFPGELLPGIVTAFTSTNSISQALTAVGIQAYRRLWTRLGARVPEDREVAILRIPATVPVITNRNVDVDERDRPIKLGDGITRADIVEFLLES